MIEFKLGLRLSFVGWLFFNLGAQNRYTDVKIGLDLPLLISQVYVIEATYL